MTNQMLLIFLIGPTFGIPRNGQGGTATQRPVPQGYFKCADGSSPMTGSNGQPFPCVDGQATCPNGYTCFVNICCRKRGIDPEPMPVEMPTPTAIDEETTTLPIDSPTPPPAKHPTPLLPPLPLLPPPFESPGEPPAPPPPKPSRKPIRLFSTPSPEDADMSPGDSQQSQEATDQTDQNFQPPPPPPRKSTRPPLTAPKMKTPESPEPKYEEAPDQNFSTAYPEVQNPNDADTTPAATTPRNRKNDATAKNIQPKHRPTKTLSENSMQTLQARNLNPDPHQNRPIPPPIVSASGDVEDPTSKTPVLAGTPARTVPFFPEVPNPNDPDAEDTTAAPTPQTVHHRRQNAAPGNGMVDVQPRHQPNELQNGNSKNVQAQNLDPDAPVASDRPTPQPHPSRIDPEKFRRNMDPRIPTSGRFTACTSNVKCNSMREPPEWCRLPPQYSWTDKNCYCADDGHTKSCVVERLAVLTGNVEWTFCIPKNEFSCN